MKKTIIEWFNELPEPYKTQALTNLRPTEKEHVCTRLCDAINHAFTWVDTPEGSDYWSKIHHIFI